MKHILPMSTHLRSKFMKLYYAETLFPGKLAR